MKFTIETEIDWLSEGGDLDSELQAKVISTIAEKIQKQIITDVSKEVMKTINDRVNELVSETFARIMSKEIKVTDQWGDVKESFGTIEEAIKTRFDRFMLEQVDSSGKATTYNGTQRMRWMIDERIKLQSEQFTKKAVEQINKAVETQLSESLKNELGTRLTKLLNVDKLLSAGQK